MKVFALHLPQFHTIPENDEWWGKGFTEWTNVRKAEPLFPGHLQPKVPLMGYYDLSEEDAIRKQAELARSFGLSGFIYYHYWFNGKLLLEKPCEILRGARDIDIDYCFCWANESWARTWDGKPGQVLMEQSFGGLDDWDNHIDYLIPFFQDNRYEKVDGRPVMYFYSASRIPNFDEMICHWNKRLAECGLRPIFVIEFLNSFNPKPASELSEAVLEFEPLFTSRFRINSVEKARRFLRKKTKQIDFLDYDRIWSLILNGNETYGEKEIIRSGFCAWDNSPRKGRASTIFTNASSESFKRYLSALRASRRSKLSDRYLVINAWNEWGEGAMLEPSTADGYGYLEAIAGISGLW